MASGKHQLLKDFLENDPNSYFLKPNNRKPTFAKLSRSSSKAASTTVHTIHKASDFLLKAVKHLHFVNSVNSRLKGILGWRSFRDGSPPSDLGLGCQTETQLWGDTCSFEEAELQREESQQNSPISILNFHFQEGGEQFIFNKMERRNNMLSHTNQDLPFIGVLDSVEVDYIEQVSPERKHHGLGDIDIKDTAMELLNQEEIDKIAMNHLFFDFFHNEMATSTNKDVSEENLRTTTAWMSGKCELEVKGKKESYIREMDREGRWRKFEEEKQELAIKIETGILDCLISELSIDLSCDLEESW